MDIEGVGKNVFQEQNKKKNEAFSFFIIIIN